MVLEKFKDSIKQFLIILLYIFIITILQLIFLDPLKNGTITIKTLVNILIYLILLIIFLFIFRKTIVPDLVDFKKNGKKYITKNFHYYLIGLIIMIISNLIIGNFISTPENEIENQKLLETLPVYSILSVVIFAPIVEELMTRVILKDTFKNPYIYIIISGLIFGLLHVIFSNNPWELFYIIPYGTLGSIFAKMYYDTNNIWCNIFFHSFHNLISIITLFIGALL